MDVVVHSNMYTRLHHGTGTCTVNRLHNEVFDQLEVYKGGNSHHWVNIDIMILNQPFSHTLRVRVLREYRNDIAPLMTTLGTINSNRSIYEYY